MNKTIKFNKDGFTLVELLAVIVVLAIIMIIAIPAVTKTMQDAKKSTFKLYAEKTLSQAQIKYQSDLLLGSNANRKVNNNRDYCYTFESLDMQVTGNYEGYVIVMIDQNLTPEYFVTLSDPSFSIKDFRIAELGSYDKYNAPLASIACPTSFTSPA